MKHNVLKKSLLDYAIKGNLSYKFRESLDANALDEINLYNTKIHTQRAELEKQIKELEKVLKQKDLSSLRGDIVAVAIHHNNKATFTHKEAKQILNDKLKGLKKELSKLREITPLDSDFTPPFEIPPTWAWVRLGDICEMNPKNDIDDTLEISFVPMALIADDFQNNFTYETKLWKEVKKGFTHLCNDSVAFAKITPCFENGKSVILKNLQNGYGAGTTELIVLLPAQPLMKEYMFYFINSAFFVNQGVKSYKGTAGQQRLDSEFVKNFPIPLPPLQEQEYIAKKLDSLVSLANRFQEIKENLKRIEKSLLKYALEGNLSKLYRMRIASPTAFDEITLYNESIRTQRARLEKQIKELESKHKKEKDKEAKQILNDKLKALKKELSKLREITPLDSDFTPPFEIPPTWAWVRLGDIGETFTGATPKTNDNSNFGDYIPFLNPGDIDLHGNITYSNRGLSKKGLEKARLIEANSILVVCIGGLIGKSCLTDRKCTCNQQINILKPYYANPKLIHFFIMCSYFQQTIKHNSTGTATPIINKTLFDSIPIPLPPLQEQEYIAQKLEELFTLARGLRVE